MSNNSIFLDNVIKNSWRYEHGYPYLSEFFSTYMKEPFRDEETIADCIASFMKDTEIGGDMGNQWGFYSSDSEIFQGIIDDIDKVIALDLPEEKVNILLHKLGMNLNITNDGWQPTSHTYKEWIKDLRDILQNEYDKRFNNKTE